MRTIKLLRAILAWTMIGAAATLAIAASACGGGGDEQPTQSDVMPPECQASAKACV